MKRVQVSLRLVFAVAGLGAALVGAWLVARSVTPGRPDAGPATERARSGTSTADPSGGAVPATPAVADRAAEEATTDAGGTLVVAVTADDGGPAAEARVLLLREERVLADGPTGVDGTAEFEAPGGAGVIVVRAPGRPVVVRPASLAAGRLDVTIEAGDVIAGFVTVDGGPPPEPFELGLGHGELPRWREVPFAVRALLGNPASVTIGAGGSFRFSGLPRGWSGRLVVPQGYRVPEEGNPFQRTFAVTAPDPDVRLDVHRLPVLTGRVVRADTGLPLAGAWITFAYRHAGGSGSRRVDSDADGRFRIVLPGETLSGAELRVTDAEGRQDPSRELEPTGLEEDRDLGTLEVGVTRVVSLVVRDGSGRPVAGAVAIARAGGVRVQSDATDDAGRTKLELPEIGLTLRAGALGHGCVDVAVPAGGDAELAVVLPAGNLLAIRVVEPDGADAARVAVELEARGALFTAPSRGPWPGGDIEPVHAAAGGTGTVSGRFGGEESSFTFHPPKDGRIVLSGIRSGVPFIVRVVDRSVRAVLAEEWVTMGATERRELRIEVPAASGVLAGRVVDGAGEPVAGAEVRVGAVAVRTGPDGSFRAGGFRTDRAPVRVDADGFEPLEEEAELVFLPVDEPVTLVLRRPRSR